MQKYSRSANRSDRSNNRSNSRNKRSVVGHFEKVELRQFSKDFIATFPLSETDREELAETIVDVISDVYDHISLPKRGTIGSAAYDFVTPIAIKLKPGDSVNIPTGIRAVIEDPQFCLLLLPRSSMGFKYRLRLDNTVGLIDYDYQFADNSGHIFAKITNEGAKDVELQAGDRFMQGLFVPFGITSDDDTTEERSGGIGSTGN